MSVRPYPSNQMEQSEFDLQSLSIPSPCPSSVIDPWDLQSLSLPQKRRDVKAEFKLLEGDDASESIDQFDFASYLSSRQAEFDPNPTEFQQDTMCTDFEPKFKEQEGFQQDFSSFGASNENMQKLQDNLRFYEGDNQKYEEQKYYEVSGNNLGVEGMGDVLFYNDTVYENDSGVNVETNNLIQEWDEIRRDCQEYEGKQEMYESTEVSMMQTYEDQTNIREYTTQLEANDWYIQQNENEWQAQPEVIKCQAQPEVIECQAQPEVIEWQAQPELIEWQAQPELIECQAQPEVIECQAQPEVIEWHAQPEVIECQAQLEVIEWQAQPELIEWQAQPELIECQAQPEVIEWQAQPEVIECQAQPEVIECQAQPEVIECQAQPEVIECQAQPEVIEWEIKPETLESELKNDQLQTDQILWDANTSESFVDEKLNENLQHKSSESTNESLQTETIYDRLKKKSPAKKIYQRPGVNCEAFYLIQSISEASKGDASLAIPHVEQTTPETK